MGTHRTTTLLLTGLLVSATVAAQTTAAEYPARTITVVVPYTVGGGSDNIARLVTSRITARTGKIIVIDNRGGAGTNIGNEYVARAQPDGYTYLLGQFTLSVNPALYAGLRYSPEKDLAPVVHIADTPTVLAVGAAFPAGDAKALLDKARAAPGALNYGSGGAGSPPHLSGELLQTLTGLKFVHVPYKGSAQAITDVIAGQLDFIIDTSTSVVPQIRGGKLRALAVAGTQRLAELPDVPTFAELGVKGMEVPAWYGFLAPTGTPEFAVRWLNTQVNEVLREPGFNERLQQMGAIAVGGTPEQFDRFMRAQTARWSAAIRQANIRLE
jgi:tripartite-type tricarboxylate transporter receptor subunit TctC